MLQHRYAKYGAIFFALLVLNVVVYMWLNWGVITVKVTDVPLRKVIRSIEWQGWVNIYTNLPLDQKVSMYVDHVPLQEAMETLAANVNGPGNGEPDRADRANRPDRANRGDRQNGTPGGDQAAGGPPPGGQGGDQAAGGPPPGAPGGGGQGGGGRGGFGRGGGGGGFGGGGGGATWNLAFFTAPSKAQIKDEISAFESGSALTNDDLKVYTYNTPLEMFMTDSEPPAADPRLQNWGGYKPPAPPPPAPTDGSGSDTPATPPPDPGPPTVQTYLQAFAESSNIWIMSMGSWATPAPTAPPANSSIISAVKRFVSSSHGYVVQAYVLRAGTGGQRNRGGFGGLEAMQDRINNALNGLPPEDQDDVRTQLAQEVQFYQSVQAAPQEQRGAMMQQHMRERIANHLGNNWRRSPTQRAQRYAHMVANRAAANAAK